MDNQPTGLFDNTEVAFSYKTDKELRKANLIFSVINHPWISATATRLIKGALAVRLPVQGLIRRTVFEHFCGGESIESTESTIYQLAQFKVKTILDYSVEGEKTEEGFDRTLQEVLRTIGKARNRQEVPFCVFKVTGIASAALLEKAQRNEPLTAEEQVSFERAKSRMDRICKKAYELDVPVLVDAEETWIQDVIDAWVYEMMECYNKEAAIVFNTFQLYCKDMYSRLRIAFHNAVMHNYFLGAKLVRGAYMEKERERAKDLGYESPIHESKEETDNAFNKALVFCISNKQRISVMCGSHNEYSNFYLTILMHKHNMQPDDKRVWFAQLYGMSDNISFNLAKAGYNVVKYVPYGPVRSVMPYLFRRAEENTSVSGQSNRELVMIRKELNRRRNRK